MNTKIKNFWLVLLILSFCACTDTSNKADKAVKEKVKIDNQGVNVNYNDSKMGDTALVFVHGWAINQTYWANQEAHFKKNYRIITLDLPGFGSSGKNRDNWTVENYAQDVSTVLTQLGIKKAILIGHSMSGAIVLETALINPSKVIGIVGIDNFKFIGTVVTPQMQTEWDKFYNSARKDFKKTVSEAMAQYLFAPSTDSLVRARVLSDIYNSDAKMAVDCLEYNDKYPLSDKLILYGKPLYLINNDVMPTDTGAFMKNNIAYQLLNIGSTGHYPMLEKPDDFNKLLEKIIVKMK